MYTQEERIKLEKDIVRIVERVFNEEFEKQRNEHPNICIEQATFDQIGPVFSEIANKMREAMSGNKLDFHKLAAATELAIIKCFPVKYRVSTPDDGIPFVVTYTLAQEVALDILLENQLSSIDVSQTIRNRMRTKIKNEADLFPPATTKDHAEVFLCFIHAKMKITSEHDYENNLWTTKFNDETAWILAMLYFYVERYIQKVVKKFEKENALISV